MSIFSVISGKINILIFDDDTVRSLGENLNRVKFFLLILAVMTSSFAVSLTGPVGFIALIAPAIARGLGDYKVQKSLPTASLVGVLLLLWSDSLGKIILAPLEIPVGVITGLLGAPAFFLILWEKSMSEKERRSN